MENFLVTGCAGFIGSHLTERLLQDGHKVIGVDNFDPYYDRGIKEANLLKCRSNPNFIFHEIDILDQDALSSIRSIDTVLHVAAKAGVRPSLDNPDSYLEVNFMGTHNILKWMVARECKRMIFASSSSVYGNSESSQFIENQATDSPISPYAVSKKSCEVLNHTYHSNYGLSILNLRLFTVYGPRQRPDLAIRKFTDLISNDKVVPVYGSGDTHRDYTFIDDVVNGFIKAIDYSNKVPGSFETFNIANGNPIGIVDLVKLIGSVLSKDPKIEYLPMQTGDVDKTYADVGKARKLLNFESKTSITEGLNKYVKWVQENRE
ncbi:MAG: GDP-mannose 4,6-dehydratase [Cyclobacteriaceae bacterium]